MSVTIKDNKVVLADASLSPSIQALKKIEADLSKMVDKDLDPGGARTLISAIKDVQNAKRKLMLF